MNLTPMLLGHCLPYTCKTNHSGCIHQSIAKRMTHFPSDAIQREFIWTLAQVGRISRSNYCWIRAKLKLSASTLQVTELVVNSPMCCMSRQVKLGLASKANAAIPAARGADADVPVCDVVQLKITLKEYFLSNQVSES